jgi:hypothetical protein
MPTRLLVGVLALGAFVGFGCGPSKLNESKKWDLEFGDLRALDLPAVAKPQKINVEFSSSAGDVTVYVFKEEDVKGPEGLESADSKEKKALVAKRGKGETFSVDIPENTPTRVIVSAHAKTSVTLKVTN